MSDHQKENEGIPGPERPVALSAVSPPSSEDAASIADAPPRKPLLSDEVIERLKHDASPLGIAIRKAMIDASRNVRDFYENMITSGILINTLTERGGEERAETPQ